MKNRRDVNMYSLIDKIKHDGHALLSSVSQFHVVAGVLGVSSLIFAVKSHKIGYLPDLFSKFDGNDSSRKLSSIAGLHNLGNNCFLNVILQVIRIGLVLLICTLKGSIELIFSFSFA